MIVTPEVATIPHSSLRNNLTQNNTYEMIDSAATTSPSTPTDTSMVQAKQKHLGCKKSARPIRSHNGYISDQKL